MTKTCNARSCRTSRIWGVICSWKTACWNCSRIITRLKRSCVLVFKNATKMLHFQTSISLWGYYVPLRTISPIIGVLLIFFDNSTPGLIHWLIVDVWLHLSVCLRLFNCLFCITIIDYSAKTRSTAAGNASCDCSKVWQSLKSDQSCVWTLLQPLNLLRYW